MRIMYFPKLIKDEETTPYNLKDCSIVIDGQNFFYSSYESSKLPYEFGSEANEHAKYLRNILKRFKEANVKCYIVFKGGNTDMTTKLEKNKAPVFDFQSNYKYVSPVFLKEVCKQVLEEAGVNYATCVMESKEDCVVLAQTLGCSVLSNDIEYCFKRAPYIPYTTIKFAHKRITCRQYKLKKFLDKHSLTEKKAAIFATLSDVTIFPQNHFNNLLETWDVLDKNVYFQNKKLLKWLAEHTEGEFVNSILQFLSNENERETFLQRTKIILEDMETNHPSIVADYLYKERKLCLISRSDPMWFEKGVATQTIAIPYINLFKHKMIQGSWAIEKKGCTDSIMLSIDIIKYAYNLLTNYHTSDICVYQSAENYLKVNTGDLNITKPIYNCSESVFQNGWKDIKRLKLFEHFLIHNDINTDVINKFPSEAKMLFIALTYFNRRKSSEEVDVTKLVHSFIICYVMLHIVFDKKESFRKKNSGISEEDSAQAIRVTERYFRVEKNEVMHIFDEDRLKLMVELEHCLLHMNYLNALCGSPFRATTYHRTFNGTFVYQLYQTMNQHDKNRHNENQFIETLFQAAPSVYKFVHRLIITYKELL